MGNLATLEILALAVGPFVDIDPDPWWLVFLKAGRWWRAETGFSFVWVVIVVGGVLLAAHIRPRIWPRCSKCGGNL